MLDQQTRPAPTELAPPPDHLDPLHRSDHLARPLHELLARIGAPERGPGSPRTVVDLGCGTGTLTDHLGRRWPGARLVALEGDQTLVRAARAGGVAARYEDLRRWAPGGTDDVIVCNAALHWLPGHPELLRGWLEALPPGGWFAWQVPGTYASPSHRLVRNLASDPEWVGALAEAVPPAEPVLDPAGYAAVANAAGCLADAWETTYLQRLAGPEEMLDLIGGTVLRPIRATLDDLAWRRFRAELAPALVAAYPPAADGTLWVPVRRVFTVAHRPR